ncbi:MAG: hypothetical protein HY720_16290 [Planctomycetes bacterium]|nr:hypothetical protein [Planctomycetota bacterium]
MFLPSFLPSRCCSFGLASVLLTASAAYGQALSSSGHFNHGALEMGLPNEGFICARMPEDARKTDPIPDSEWFQGSVAVADYSKPGGDLTGWTVTFRALLDGNGDNTFLIEDPRTRRLTDVLEMPVAATGAFDVHLVSTDLMGTSPFVMELTLPEGGAAIEVFRGPVHSFVLDPQYTIETDFEPGRIFPKDTDLSKYVTYTEGPRGDRDRFEPMSPAAALTLSLTPRTTADEVDIRVALVHSFALHDIDFRNDTARDLWGRQVTWIEFVFAAEHEVTVLTLIGGLRPDAGEDADLSVSISVSALHDLDAYLDPVRERANLFQWYWVRLEDSFLYQVTPWAGFDLLRHPTPPLQTDTRRLADVVLRRTIKHFMVRDDPQVTPFRYEAKLDAHFEGEDAHYLGVVRTSRLVVRIVPFCFWWGYYR